MMYSSSSSFSSSPNTQFNYGTNLNYHEMIRRSTTMSTMGSITKRTHQLVSEPYDLPRSSSIAMEHRMKGLETQVRSIPQPMEQPRISNDQMFDQINQLFTQFNQEFAQLQTSGGQPLPPATNIQPGGRSDGRGCPTSTSPLPDLLIDKVKSPIAQIDHHSMSSNPFHTPNPYYQNFCCNPSQNPNIPNQFQNPNIQNRISNPEPTKPISKPHFSKPIPNPAPTKYVPNPNSPHPFPNQNSQKPFQIQNPYNQIPDPQLHFQNQPNPFPDHHQSLKNPIHHQNPIHSPIHRNQQKPFPNPILQNQNPQNHFPDSQIQFRKQQKPFPNPNIQTQFPNPTIQNPILDPNLQNPFPISKQNQQNPFPISNPISNLNRPNPLPNSIFQMQFQNQHQENLRYEKLVPDLKRRRSKVQCRSVTKNYWRQNIKESLEDEISYEVMQDDEDEDTYCEDAEKKEGVEEGIDTMTELEEGDRLSIENSSSLFGGNSSIENSEKGDRESWDKDTDYDEEYPPLVPNLSAKFSTLHQHTPQPHSAASTTVDKRQHPSPSVLIHVLRTVGNIVTGDDVQTQCIINYQALPYLKLLTHNHKKSIKKEACWPISNITAGNKDRIQAVIAAGIFAPLVNLLQTAEFDIKKEAAGAISNATSLDIDGLKFPGGSHNLMLRAFIKEVIDSAPKHDVYASTGDLAEHVLRKGPSPCKQYAEEQQDFPNYNTSYLCCKQQEIEGELYDELWRACAGLLVTVPREGELVFYFFHSHIDPVEASTNQVADHQRPVYDLPSKILCHVMNVHLKAKADTDEVFAQMTLLTIPTRDKNVVEKEPLPTPPPRPPPEPPPKPPNRSCSRPQQYQYSPPQTHMGWSTQSTRVTPQKISRIAQGHFDKQVEGMATPEQEST